MRLVCSRCHARLVPAMSGLRCPRMAACGRGGIVESGRALHPFGAPPGGAGVRA